MWFLGVECRRCSATKQLSVAGQEIPPPVLDSLCCLGLGCSPSAAVFTPVSVQL